MNWRRGLFRLWIIGTALFVIAVAVISYSDIKAEFDAVALGEEWDASPFEIVVPQLCGEARGVVGVDYATDRRAPNFFDRFDEPNSSDTCWYAMSKFRPLYPEFKNMSDRELSRMLYTDRGIPIRIPSPWFTLGTWAGIASGVPLAVLILGASLVWAFSGFAVTRS
jgi:hypothetical protein